MTNSSSNRIVAAISDSATCIGLANWLAIPSSASTRQISFRINRVAISIVATYSNNTISRNEAVGAIQFMKSRPQKKRGHINKLKVGHIKFINVPSLFLRPGFHELDCSHSLVSGNRIVAIRRNDRYRDTIDPK